jgi:hypothetical protein
MNSLDEVVYEIIDISISSMILYFCHLAENIAPILGDSKRMWILCYSIC